jgi:SAM-dependent methyltransferase
VTQPGVYAQRNLDLAARDGGKPLAAAEPDLFAALQERLDALLADSPSARILNAGCGIGGRYVPVFEDPALVVGIDVEPGESEDVDERLVGDIESYDFGDREFDAVYCWNVLEHVPDPSRALANLVSTLRPGGVLVLALPHARSVKAVITRVTPHRLHAWLWRRVLNPKEVSAGPTPFPTVLSNDVKPEAVRTFARANGLSVEFYAEYESWAQKKMRMLLRLKGGVFSALSALVRALSFGRATATATDVVIVLQKRS